MWKACRRVRRTEPLPKMYALQYTPPKATCRGKCTSENHLIQRVYCARRQSGLEAGRKQVFSGSDGGLGGGIWTCMGYVSDATHWFLHKVNVDQVVDTLRAFKTAACLKYPARAMLLYLTQHLHPFTGRNSCRHSPFLMRTPSWMACARSCQPMAYLARAEGVSFKADSMADLTAKKVESGGDRKRIDNLPIGQVQ